MRWKFRVVMAQTAAFSLFALSCEVPSPEATISPREVHPGFKPDAEVFSDRPRARFRNNGGCGGCITATGADWFELQEAGKPPRRILTDGTKPGGNAKGLGWERSHWVSDLRFGDIVVVMTGIDGNEEVALAIWIQRRPGGTIPPQHDDPFVGTQNAAHLREQAEQDWEEKGIPIPARYLDPNGQAPWTNPPYLPFPVAPMPRPVAPKP